MIVASLSVHRSGRPASRFAGRLSPQLGASVVHDVEDAADVSMSLRASMLHSRRFKYVFLDPAQFAGTDFETTASEACLTLLPAFHMQFELSTPSLAFWQRYCLSSDGRGCSWLSVARSTVRCALVQCDRSLTVCGPLLL